MVHQIRFLQQMAVVFFHGQLQVLAVVLEEFQVAHNSKLHTTQVQVQPLVVPPDLLTTVQQRQ